MDKQIRRRWHNMLVAALADKELGAEEKQYLEEQRKALGLSQDDANAIVADFRQNKGGIELSGSREERIGLLRDIIKIFLADDHLDKRERKMMVAVASHLMIDEFALKRMINECRQELKNTETVGYEDEEKPEPHDPPPADGTPKNDSYISQDDLPPASYSSPAAPAGLPEKRPLPSVTGEIHQKTGIELLTVPAGNFFYGDMSVGGVIPEQPCKAFKIGKYAVTNEQWRKFEQESGHSGREDYGEEFNGPRQPVVGVNIDDVQAYCEWAGLRLPTEVEWERAARGTDGRFYPWGKECPDDHLANFGRGLFASNQPRTVDVGSYPQGVSPVGAYEMVGNVDEWCQRPDETDKEGFPIRSGNWLSAVYALKLFYHNFKPRDTRANTIGFRVACDA